MHIPYQSIRKHPPDFRVKYRFYSKEEGGRQTIIPYQGYRSDFSYEHEDHANGEVFMINPEFEDADGNIILKDDASVPAEGTALMWVLFPQMRPYHSGKIKAGTKGHFREGSRKVAECVVTDIIGLETNPKM